MAATDVTRATGEGGPAPLPQEGEARGRALLGVAVVAGWYLVALAAIGVGIALTATQVASDPEDVRAVEFLPAAVAALLLLTLRPHGQRFIVPGPRVAAAENPELFALLTDVVEQVGAKPLDEVYLAPGAAVDVVDRDGLGGKRALVLGAGFARVASERQLRAAIAHRLARRHAGGSRLEAFIERARGSSERGLQELADAGRTPITSVPYALNAQFFLRSTAALERSHELQADAVAAGIAGGDALAAVLELEPGLPAAHDAWLAERAAGKRGAFDEFVAREDVARQIRFAAFRRREDTASGGSDVPLRDRIARALSTAAGEEGAPPDRPARMLITGFEAREGRLAADAAARRASSPAAA